MDLKKQPNVVLEAWPIWDSCKLQVCTFLSRNVEQVFGGLLCSTVAINFMLVNNFGVLYLE